LPIHMVYYMQTGSARLPVFNRIMRFRNLMDTVREQNQGIGQLAVRLWN
jgi:hypothetical protein